MKMILKDRMAWTTALRSGDYQQGKHFLKAYKNSSTTPVFCCLGVLCEVMGLKSVPNKEHHLDCQTFLYGEEQKCEGDLPSELRNKFKSVPTGMIVKLGVGQHHSLSYLNDQFGMSFCKIADIIDQHVEIIEAYPETNSQNSASL